MVKASERSYASAEEQLHAEKIHDLFPADWTAFAPVSVIEKVCTQCGLSKALDRYDKQLTGRFRRKASCKGCIKQARPTCAECNTIPHFGMAGGKPTHCAIHKIEGMIRGDGMCTDCRSKQAIYNIIGQTARY